MGMNLCRACGRTFGNLKSFATHRTGSFGEPIYKRSSTGRSRRVIGQRPPTRRCMNLAEIQALGMTQNAKGWWSLPNQAARAGQEDEEVLEETMLLCESTPDDRSQSQRLAGIAPSSATKYT